MFRKLRGRVHSFVSRCVMCDVDSNFLYRQGSFCWVCSGAYFGSHLFVMKIPAATLFNFVLVMDVLIEKKKLVKKSPNLEGSYNFVLVMDLQP